MLGLALMSGALVMAADTDHPAPVAAQRPGSSGQELLDFILVESPYTEWGTFPADRWSDFGGYLERFGPRLGIGTTGSTTFVPLAGSVT